MTPTALICPVSSTWALETAGGRTRFRRLDPPPRIDRRRVLTWEQVLAIRAARAAGATCPDLGRLYGVTGEAVRKVCLGETWKAVG